MDRERQNSSQSRNERELRQETRVRSMLSARTLRSLLNELKTLEQC